VKIRRTFPIRDYVDVDCGELGKLSVKFKDPTVEQLKAIHKDGDMAYISYCQYCVEDIRGLEDEKGEPIEFKLIRGVLGFETEPSILHGLASAGVAATISLFYHEHFALSEADKKK
jgi:hypothetical protein